MEEEKLLCNVCGKEIYGKYLIPTTWINNIPIGFEIKEMTKREYVQHMDKVMIREGDVNGK